MVCESNENVEKMLTVLISMMNWIADTEGLLLADVAGNGGGSHENCHLARRIYELKIRLDKPRTKEV